MDAGMRVCLTGSFKKKDDCHEKYGIEVGKYGEFANFTLVASYVAAAGRGKSLDDFYRPPQSDEEVKTLRCPGHSAQELVVYAQDGLAQPCCSVQAGYNM